MKWMCVIVYFPPLRISSVGFEKKIVFWGGRGRGVMMSRDQPGSVRLRFTNVDTKWHTGTYKHFLTLILVNYVCGIFAFKPLGLTPPHPPSPRQNTSRIRESYYVSAEVEFDS